MYEEEVKKFATFVNNKFDILGERIPESVEQATLEFIFGLTVKLMPEMAFNLPVRALVVQLAMSFIAEPEAVGQKIATFLNAQNEEGS